MHNYDLISPDNPPPIAVNIPEQDPSSSAPVSQCKRKTAKPKSANPKPSQPSKATHFKASPSLPSAKPTSSQSVSSVPLIRNASSKPPTSPLSAKATTSILPSLSSSTSATTSKPFFSLPSLKVTNTNRQTPSMLSKLLLTSPPSAKGTPKELSSHPPTSTCDLLIPEQPHLPKDFTLPSPSENQSKSSLSSILIPSTITNESPLSSIPQPLASNQSTQSVCRKDDSSTFPVQNEDLLSNLQPAPVHQPVLISSSPIKDDPNDWIRKLDLFQNDKAVLQSTKWLTDGIIYAAQCLLREETEGKILGWQPSVLSDRKQLFKPLPPRAPFIQIINVAKCHWIVASNVDVRDGGCYSDVVCIYDSGRPTHISGSLKKMICSFFKCTYDTLRFDVMNVQAQPNGYDCGVYAIACATELAYGYDPVVSVWKDEVMRNHLLECLESGKLTRFPRLRERRIMLGTRVRKTQTVEVLCICRTMNEKTRPMIECESCLKWFHKDCMGPDVNKSFKGVKWVCRGCEDFIK